MEFILLVAGAVALVLLWKRVDQLERELRDVRAMTLDLRYREPGSAVAETEVPTPAAEATAKPPITRRAATILPRRDAPQPVQTAAVDRPAEPVQPAAETPAPHPRLRGFAFDFEELFGRQLPIWAGGITLAVAGFFLVRYAIDVGLLSPAVRVAMGLVFGLGLIGGAEAAHQFKDRVADVRVPQALAGAGLATLYGSVFLAGTFYGLVGATTAFIGLAVITAAAIALSFRFGLPCAVLGLVGGFAAPALVGSEEANLPLLAFYLSLVAGGLGHAARKQGAFAQGGGWGGGGWLGLAGIVGGLGWGTVMLIAQPGSPSDVISVGLFLVLLGAVLPVMVLPEMRESRWLRLAAGGFASIQMAALLDSSGYDMLAWALYMLLGAALAVLAWRGSGAQSRALREAGAIAGAVAAWMMMGPWSSPDPWVFAGVGAGLALIFAGVPLARIWRGDACGADVAALGAMPVLLLLAGYWHFGSYLDERVYPLALAGAALAALPALAAWKHGTHGWRAAVLEVSAVLTLYGGIAQAAPWDWQAWIAGAGTAALALALRERHWASRAGLSVSLSWAVFPLGWWLAAGLYSLGGNPMLVSDIPTPHDAMIYLVPAAVASLAVAWQMAGGRFAQPRIIGGIGILAVVASAHIGFKRIFAIREVQDQFASWHDFADYGLGERIVWEALLLGAAVLAWKLRPRWSAAGPLALAFGGAALGHFAIYTGLLHNPLWQMQAVGQTPIANLLVPAYAVGAAALLLLVRAMPHHDTLARPVRVAADAALMVLISIFALSELRQAFSGTFLTTTDVQQAEDLLRSLLGIVLAIGFLLWGARTGTRSWRIGSLVLLLGAVCKVFIYDTSGLDGLVRIASFLALGFSLIGIGWFYSRVLRGPSGEEARAGEGGAEPAIPVSPPDPATPVSGSTAAS